MGAGLANDGGLDQLIFFRPYITEEGVSGWFDDFSHSGFPDAIGGIGRIYTSFNAFTPTGVGRRYPDLRLTGSPRTRSPS